MLSAEILDGERPAAGTWPVTYDPARPDLDGMEYLHPTDEPNPGSSLVGYTFTLQAHRKAALHVILRKLN